jgi:alpha-glucosidase (family GH31 glycosyl hydrolase)
MNVKLHKDSIVYDATGGDAHFLFFIG